MDHCLKFFGAAEESVVGAGGEAFCLFEEYAVLAAIVGGLGVVVAVADIVRAVGKVFFERGFLVGPDVRTMPIGG